MKLQEAYAEKRKRNDEIKKSQEGKTSKELWDDPNFGDTWVTTREGWNGFIYAYEHEGVSYFSYSMFLVGGPPPEPLPQEDLEAEDWIVVKLNFS